MRTIGEWLWGNSVLVQSPQSNPSLIRKTLHLLLFAALALFVVLGGREWLGSALDDAFCNLTNCHPPGGPPASWAAQVAAMQEAAKEHAQEPARIVSFVAVPRSGSRSGWNPNEALEVKAEFEVKSGGLSMTYLDTDPTKTVNVSSWTGNGDGEAAIAAEKGLGDLLYTIKISPREAVSLTWPIASKRAQRAHLPVFPSLILDTRETSWALFYLSSKGAEPGDALIVCEFEVNAATGEITQRR